MTKKHEQRGKGFLTLTQGMRRKRSRLESWSKINWWKCGLMPKTIFQRKKNLYFPTNFSRVLFCFFCKTLQKSRTKVLPPGPLKCLDHDLMLGYDVTCKSWPLKYINSNRFPFKCRGQRNFFEPGYFLASCGSWRIFKEGARFLMLFLHFSSMLKPRRLRWCVSVAALFFDDALT